MATCRVSLPLLSCCLLGVIAVTWACNEAVCASLVSKCLLLESCECDMKVNCTCCKDCYQCLHDLYTECCSCVGMCPEQNVQDARLGDRSSVEQLKEPIPALFTVLTEEPDHLLRFMAYTFPAHRDIQFFNQNSSSTNSFEFSIMDEMGGVKTLEIDDELSINCTVAFMSQCMSMHKCKLSCSSMGASAYRWFHDGCCECVGHTCYNYGMNVSKCLLCSEDVLIEEPAVEEYHDEYEEEEESVGSPSPFGSSFPDTTDIPWDLVTRYVQNKSSLECERYFKEVLKVKYWNGKIPQPWTLYSDYIFFKMLSEEGPATIEDVPWIKIQQLLSSYFKVDVDFLKTRLQILSCRFPEEQSLQKQLFFWLKTCHSYEKDFPTNAVSWNHDSMNHGTPKQQNLHRQLKLMCYPEQGSCQGADGGGISKGSQANTDHPPDSSVCPEPVLYRESILPSLASCVEIQSTAVSRT